jgi:hypothetical protein
MRILTASALILIDHAELLMAMTENLTDWGRIFIDHLPQNYDQRDGSGFRLHSFFSKLRVTGRPSSSAA